MRSCSQNILLKSVEGWGVKMYYSQFLIFPRGQHPEQVRFCMVLGDRKKRPKKRWNQKEWYIFTIFNFP